MKLKSSSVVRRCDVACIQRGLQIETTKMEKQKSNQTFF